MSYAVLSQSPAQKLPAHAPPSSSVHFTTRRRSATTSAISAWAAQIVPGSPAPPTPHTPSKSPRTPITGGRRPSVSAGLRSPGSFLNLLDTPSVICTPSPKALEHKPVAAVGLDFLAQGYTAVIVQLPTLSPLAPRTAPATEANKIPLPPPIPESPTRLKPKKSFTRLRSLSFKSTKKMLSTRPTSSSQSSSAKPSKAKSHKSSTPQSRYAHLIAPGGGAGALPLAQEVQLSQMLDGGSLDANVRRVVERHARDTGAVSDRSKSRDPSSRKDRRAIEKRGPSGQVGGGVSGVHRDGQGGMWWDEDEQLELVELLPETLSATSPVPPPKKTLGILPRLKTKSAKEELRPEWVNPSAPTSPVSPGTDVLRRGSATSSGSRDSDLDPRNAVRPRESVAVGGAFVAGYSVDMHRKQSGYAPGVLDAFDVSPLDKSAPEAGNTARPRPRARHRPAPLTLSPPEFSPPAVPVPPSTTSSRHEKPRRVAAPPPLPAVTVPLASEGRRDFFASSFAPAAAPTPSTSTPSSASSSKENSGAPKDSRRSSVTFGLSSGFSAFANSVTPKSARRASVASPASPRTFVPPAAGSSVHLPLPPKEKERTLKHKASRSKLTGFFKSRS